MNPHDESARSMPLPGEDSSGVSDISLIIRYCRSQTIRRALDSVLAQTWRSGPVTIEILVVDAAGTNLIPPELSAYGLSSTPPLHSAVIGSTTLRWITRCEQLPRAEALQTGIDAARGELTMFLDDDDAFDPEHMEKLFLGYQRAKLGKANLVAVSTGVRFVREDPQSSDVTTIYTWDAPLRPERLFLANQLPLISFAVSTDVIRSCRIDTTLSIYEDWDLMIALAARGEFVHLSGITASYFLNPTGSGVHDPAIAEPVSQRVRQKWIGHFRASDFQKMGEELLLADQTRIDNQKLSEALDQSREELARIRQELHDTKASLHNTQLALDTMKNSRSWRITAPLRKIAQMWKRDDT